jgi:cobyrinic acid a,c-diamide synthase
MITVETPRLYIGGSSGSVGKSLLCLALAVELRSRNLSVACCTSVPRLAESILYQRITRRYVRCLDKTLLSEESVVTGFHGASIGTDIILIDGHAGLYDGQNAGSLWGSDASLARLTKTPVVLVLDGLQYGTSIAPLARGYLEAAKDFSIGAVLVNKSCTTKDGQERDRLFFDASMQIFGLPKTSGAYSILRGGTALPRQPISQLDNRTSLPRQFFIDAVAELRRSVDVDGLLELAYSAPTVTYDLQPLVPSLRKCRIAVAQDVCFSTCFQDNLELLRLYGAELVPFSPVADIALPKRIGGVYLPGGYVASYGPDLDTNDSIKEALRAFVKGGGVLYSEGAGTAYLAEEYSIEGTAQTHRGVGVLPGRVRTGKEEFKLFVGKLIIPTIIGDEHLEVRGLMPGDWLFEQTPQVVHALQGIFQTGDEWEEGFVGGSQIFSTLGFLHWGHSPHVAKNLVEAAQAVSPLSVGGLK